MEDPLVGTTDERSDDRAHATEVDDDGNPFGEEHAWWAERERLQRVFVAPRVDDGGDESPLSQFWSPESLFSWGRRPDGEAWYDEEPAFDPYEVLGVPQYAPWDQVTAAHRRLAKQHHPDRLGQVSEQEREASEERMRLVNQAYNELRRQRAGAASAG